MTRLFHFAIAFALGAAVWAQPGLAAAPRQPTSQWILEFADDKCYATRNYGSSDKPLLLVLKPSPMGEVLQLTVARHDRAGDTLQLPAIVEIGDHPTIRTSALAWNARRAKIRSLRINLPEEEAGLLARASTLRIFSAGEFGDTFALSNMGNLMKAMKTCVDDLRKHWNIGPEHEAKLRTRATGELWRYFKEDDYPEKARQSSQGGTVEFALLIDELGRIADCTVIQTSSIAVLDAQSCLVLEERARLTPAMGADGKPTKDAVTNRVTWRMR